MGVLHVSKARHQPLWLALILALAPPAALILAWHRLPMAPDAGPCLDRPVVADEVAATAFSIALRRAILDNPGGPFELRATDHQLTAYVALNTQGRQLAEPQIRITTAGEVCFSGRIVGLGLLNPRFRITADLYVAHGMLQVHLRHVVINERLLPPSLKDLLQRVINESLRDAGWPLEIQAVHLADGEITIVGRRLSAP
jgi:hypothetical protein